MTTGWQFATQIEGDDDPIKFELKIDPRERNNQSALMIAERQVLPSMLDPAFEDDASDIPRATS